MLDLLREPHILAVDVDLLDRRLQDAPHPQRAVRLARDLVEKPCGQRPDDGVERAIPERHADRDVARERVGAVEDRVERDLEVLEVLDRQVEPYSETTENEVRDPMELRITRDRERDLVSHEST